MNAGATPKSTKSASESSSAPKREVPFRARAMLPSRPSRTAASAIAMTAHSILSSSEKRIAVRPRQSARSVTRLGSSRRSGTPRNRRPDGTLPRGDTADSLLSGAYIPSARPERPHRLDGFHVCDHGLPSDGARIDADENLRVVRQIDVDARTEPDQAETIAGAKTRAFIDEANNPPRNEAGDLHHAEDAGLSFDDETIALIILAGLVEIRVEKKTRLVSDLGDPSGDRRAIDVAIEDGHEDRNTLQGPVAKTKLGRRRGESCKTNHAVGGRHD